MDISISQLLTHTIGFLITLWLLSKFAWKPLLALMDERRTRITDEFAAIEQEKVKVAKQQAEYESRLKEIENERRAKMVEAVEEGKKVAAELKAAAMHEAKELTAKAKGDVERELTKARATLKEEMITITLSASEKLLRERLNEPKQRELVTRYIDELQKA
jgi:F-type H+-transporting ATPase subunit b